MNCLLEFGEPKDGKRLARCRRCSTALTVPVASGENIQVACTALPLPHELGEWLLFFAEAFAIDRAAAICRYVRWRFRGSKLEDLPAGLPRPNVPQPLSEAELCELRQTDPTLAGNRLESMFKALGIPACGGCQSRRDWLNKCHQWLRDATSPP